MCIVSIDLLTLVVRVQVVQASRSLGSRLVQLHRWLRERVLNSVWVQTQTAAETWQRRHHLPGGTAHPVSLKENAHGRTDSLQAQLILGGFWCSTNIYQNQ